jgi:steroid 5-alpha reductase family enzyme
MTLMFLFISIPLMEQRSLERRPDYARLIESVSMLVPLPRRKSAS